MSDDGSRLPGTPDEEQSDPIILHVDMDCFYAACERRREPKLRGEPVVVGMGYEGGENHGAVATSSYEAREYGVESAQAISTALERLPRKAEVEEQIEGSEDSERAGEDPEVDPEESGYYRPVDLDYYGEVGSEVKEILHDSADVVREVSIDEAYLDVTDRTAWEVAEGFARHVKHRIDREVGVMASVGVAPNMSAAKIASDYDKPDGLVVVEPGEVRDFLADLDVAEIHGVGPVTARKLRDMDIDTASDLAAADRSALEDRFGERGIEMYRRARGEDDRDVTPRGKPKSLSRESAFTEETDDSKQKREQIRTLAEAVADRASRKDAMYRTIGIKVVTPPYDVNTRAKSLSGPVDDPELVEEVALELSEEFEDEAVRKVGVRVSNLSFAEGDQASLGDGWGTGDSGGGSGGSDVKSGDSNDTGRNSAERDDEAESEAGSEADFEPSGQSSLGAGWEEYGTRASDSEGPEDGDGEAEGGDGEAEGGDGEAEDVYSGSEADSDGGSDTDDDPEGQVSLGDFE